MISTEQAFYEAGLFQSTLYESGIVQNMDWTGQLDWTGLD